MHYIFHVRKEIINLDNYIATTKINYIYMCNKHSCHLVINDDSFTLFLDFDENAVLYKIHCTKPRLIDIITFFNIVMRYCIFLFDFS